MSPRTIWSMLNVSLGKALAEAWHAKGWTVIAAVRDVSKMEAKERMIVVKLDADSWTDPKEASPSPRRNAADELSGRPCKSCRRSTGYTRSTW